MIRKLLASIIVILFITIIFNGSIIAKEDTSKITIIKDLINAREKFEKLDDSFIQNCTETKDYNGLLKFMGNDSRIVLNAHVSAKGMGLYLGKRLSYIKLMHPFPRLLTSGIFPSGLVSQWIMYVNYYKDDNASTYVEPESGEPFYINGTHSILVCIWQITPINRINALLRNLRIFTNEKINLTLPKSLLKWKFTNFFPWGVSWLNGAIPIGLIESLMMLIVWPFNIKTSFLGLNNVLFLSGMSSFIIYNKNSTVIT